MPIRTPLRFVLMSGWRRIRIKIKSIPHEHKCSHVILLIFILAWLVVSPSHHNFFVRHIYISSGANHTFGASLTYFLPPFGCRQLPARTLHFNQPLLRTVHYFCYFICGSITSTTSPDISLFSATSIDVTQLPTLHLWFQQSGGASNITVYCSNKK